MSKKIDKIIAKIQQEAKKKVTAYTKKSAPKVNPKAIKKSVPKVNPESITAKTIKDQVNSAFGIAKSNKIAREYVGNLSDLIKHIVRNVSNVSNLNTNFEIYPNNCKFMLTNTDSGIIVIEESPQFRTVFDVSDNFSLRDKPNNFRIPLPYTVYLISYELHNNKFSILNFGVAFGKKPISSIDDRMFYTNLPHTHKNSSVCFPLNKAYHDSLKALVEYAIKSFWQSAFHYEFNDSFRVNSILIDSFEKWSKIENQLDILKASFKIGPTVKKQLEQFSKNLPMNSNKLAMDISKKIIASIEPEYLAKLMISNTEEIVDVALKNALQLEN